MTYGQETSPVKFTVGFIIACLLIVGAGFSAATEARHEREAEAQAFKDHGCVIYQDYKGMDIVPVKCNNDFVEHEARK